MNRSRPEKLFLQGQKPRDFSFVQEKLTKLFIYNYWIKFLLLEEKNKNACFIKDLVNETYAIF